MAANMQTRQELTPVEYLDAALVFIDKARKELGTAPKPIRDELDGVRENVDNFKVALPDELKEAIWDENRECQGCHLCQRDPGGPWDEATRECQAREPMECPAVREVLA